MENQKILVSISTVALITVIAFSLVPSSCASQTYIYGTESYPLLYVANSDWSGIYSRSYDGNGVEGYSYGAGMADNGVYGETNSGYSGEAGVTGYSSESACGVYGHSDKGYGVRGYGGSGSGDYGGVFTSAGYRGLYARGASGWYAAYLDGSIYVAGSIFKSGSCHFVRDHPTSKDKIIVYTCLEGGETGIYTRGSAQLIDGEATVPLPDDFSLVASTEGLTVQVTATADCNGLYVVSKSPSEIVVRELGVGGGDSNPNLKHKASGSDKAQGSDATFDYLVNGIREGYEDYKAVQQLGPESSDPGLAPELVDEEDSKKEKRSLQP